MSPTPRDQTRRKSIDTNNDGILSDKEIKTHKVITQIENQDRKEDAQRNMAWFSLFGMLLYPLSVILSSWVGLENASIILGDIAPTYFVSVAAIVAAFYGKEAYTYVKTTQNSLVDEPEKQ